MAQPFLSRSPGEEIPDPALPGHASFKPSARRRPDAPGTAPAEYGPEDFPGCESFHLPASQIDHYEGRLEFWDGRTETAWKVCEPTSIQHEGPSRRLVQMAERVASVRGSRILCFGSSDLVHLDAAGRKRWLMQADEVLYLHPDRIRLQGSAIDVDTDPLPDVVLEVDHSTDVRRRKLGIYQRSGFPEIWVLVPWESSVGAPGLVIHVRRGDGYREEAESAAFPGWKGKEVYRALTEEPLSAPAWEALERVARAMGAREGTRPEDDPMTRSLSREAAAKGYVEGMHATVLQVLESRGIAVSVSLHRHLAEVGDISGAVLVNAALACRDEADFRRRIQ